MTVAEYFKRAFNRPLKFPELPCVEVGSGALLPLELCTVPPGQIMRKQVPPEKTKDVLEFATKKPQDRLASIKQGLSVLDYGQSEYVRQFGMHVDPSVGPLKVDARVLPAPTLRYGPGSRQAAIVSSYVLKFCCKLLIIRFRPQETVHGMYVLFLPQMNCADIYPVGKMVDKKFYQPTTIKGWVVVVYERQQRFRQEAADDMIKGLLDSFKEVG